MAAYFFDSSAIVKRYVREVGTAWVRDITEPVAGHRLYVARIAGVEVVSVLTRQGMLPGFSWTPPRECLVDTG